MTRTAPHSPVSEKTTLRAFATDFDGTLAHDGAVPKAALEGLHELKEAGYRLIMVTGRQLEELSQIFVQLDLFDMVVAENGGLLYSPVDKILQPLAESPPLVLIERLLARGVTPLAIGHVIVATWEPHHREVLEAIKDLGLELQVIFNKGAVMILPAGINKASGLEAALDHLQIPPAEVVAVGDAENDHAMLALSRFPVAVANALPALKEHAKFVTKQRCGEGVAELIDMLLAPGFVIP